jgi:hypothetical protein
MEAVVKYLRYYPTICLEWLRKRTRKLGRDGLRAVMKPETSVLRRRTIHSNINPSRCLLVGLYSPKICDTNICQNENQEGKTSMKEVSAHVKCQALKPFSTDTKGSEPVLHTSVQRPYLFPCPPGYLTHTSETNEPNHLWTDLACHYALWLMVFVAWLLGDG